MEKNFYFIRKKSQKVCELLFFFYLNSLCFIVLIIVDSFIDIFIGLPLQCPYKACNSPFKTNRQQLFKHIRAYHDPDLPALNGGKSYIFRTTSGHIIKFNGKKKILKYWVYVHILHF